MGKLYAKSYFLILAVLLWEGGCSREELPTLYSKEFIQQLDKKGWGVKSNSIITQSDSSLVAIIPTELKLNKWHYFTDSLERHRLWVCRTNYVKLDFEFSLWTWASIGHASLQPDAGFSLDTAPFTYRETSSEYPSSLAFWKEKDGGDSLKLFARIYGNSFNGEAMLSDTSNVLHLKKREPQIQAQ